MAVMTESKIAAMHRLRAEGRWAEASLFKDETISELRGEGMKRVQASAEAWRRMIEKYPPLPVEEDASTDALDDALPEVADMLERLDDDVSPDLVRDTLWAYDHLEHKGVKPDSAPSRGAWSLLKWAREYRSRFFESFLPKAMAAKGKDTVEEEKLVHDKKNVEQIRGVLARLVEQAKPPDLDEVASDFVTQWSRTHGRRLSAEARRDLEAGIGSLVVSYRE